MARKRFAVSNQEFGRGPRDIHQFDSLKDLAKYVKDRWQGPEYIDGEVSFHTDYCTYELHRCKLADLGKRVWNEEFQYFDWEWHDQFKNLGDD